MPRTHDRLAVPAIAIGLLAANIGFANAALPPWWQSAREIETILQDGRVHDAFKYEEPILSISTTGNDVYTIKTPRCSLDVTIVDKPMEEGIVGPRQFELQIGTADCQ
jgi:hypothetical protein